jgi:putative flippase GtrA
VNGACHLSLKTNFSWIGRIALQFPPGQFGRYLAVGSLNSAFGYGSYAGLTALLTPCIPFGYIVASILANFLGITFSFLNYKRFVFKTKGNYLREWLRCIVVYGSIGLIGTAALGPIVYILRLFAHAEISAPYVAGAIVTVVTVTVSFLGHKNFSFASSPDLNSQESK